MKKYQKKILVICKEQDKTKNVFSNFNSYTKLTFPCSKATKETLAKGVQYLQGWR